MDDTKSQANFTEGGRDVAEWIHSRKNPDGSFSLRISSPKYDTAGALEGLTFEIGPELDGSYLSSLTLSTDIIQSVRGALLDEGLEKLACYDGRYEGLEKLIVSDIFVSAIKARASSITLSGFPMNSEAQAHLAELMLNNKICGLEIGIDAINYLNRLADIEFLEPSLLQAFQSTTELLHISTHSFGGLPTSKRGDALLLTEGYYCLMAVLVNALDQNSSGTSFDMRYRGTGCSGDVP
jgi:hypothetical protein